MSPAVGAKLGRYEIRWKIGGMGEVYLAPRAGHDGTVAIL
jgi:hypothetical protein